MDQLIAKQIGYSLSGHDIHELTHNKCNVIGYPDLLNRFSSLQQAMGEHKAVVILYETKDKIAPDGERDVYGHWVCIFEIAPGVAEFFDSYGIRVDDELKFISPEYAFETKQMGRLTDLIKASPYRVVYNKVRLQTKGKAIETCGRWVALRLRWRQTPLADFQRLFVEGKKMTPDEYVTTLTLL